MLRPAHLLLVLVWGAPLRAPAQEVPWRTVQGLVVDVHAKPLVAASVEIHLESDVASSPALAETRTDGQGMFLLRGRWPASLPLVVSAVHPGHARATCALQQTPLDPDLPSRLELLDAGPLQLRVADDQGHPLADCAVAATLDYRQHDWHEERATDTEGLAAIEAAPFGLLHLAVWHPDHGPVFLDHHHAPERKAPQIQMERGAGRVITVRATEAVVASETRLSLELVTRGEDRRRLPMAAGPKDRPERLANEAHGWQLRGLPTDAELRLRPISFESFVTPPVRHIAPGTAPVVLDLEVREDFRSTWRESIRLRLIGAHESNPANLALLVKIHNDTRQLTTDGDHTTRWPTPFHRGASIEVSSLDAAWSVAAIEDSTGVRAEPVEERAGPFAIPTPRPRWHISAPNDGDVDITLTPAFALRGVVLGPKEEPRAGVRIALQWEVPNGGTVDGSGWPNAITTVSDRRGHFTLGGLQPTSGTFRLEAGDAGIARSPTFELDEAVASRSFRMIVPESAEVFGLVSDSDGRPVPGAAVHLFQFTQAGLGTLLETVTDATGHYLFAEVPPAALWYIHPLSGQVPRPAAGSGNLRIERSEQVNHDLTLAPPADQPAAAKRR